MIEHSATLSDCGRYRYDLKRIWDPNLSYVLWIGLNPSTADASEDDPTIRKMMGFARKWQHGGIIVCNLFAFRATFPADLMDQEFPLGPGDSALLEMHVMDEHVGVVVCCWGNHGAYLDRDIEVYDRISTLPLCRKKIQCLGYTKAGHPKHPGRIAYATRLQPFIRRKA